MTSIQQRRIKIFAEHRYRQDERQLDLGYSSQSWADVLLMQDWSMIESLRLSDCGINDDSITVLQSLNLPYLSDLDLSGNKFTGKGVKKLIEQEWPRLNSLKLDRNNIQNEEQSLFIQKIWKIVTLHGLELSSCGLTSVGIQSIVDYSPINLTKLALSENLIGNKGVKLLIKSFLPNLEILLIGNCKIEEEGLKHLTKANWPKLKNLDLGCFSYRNSNKIQLNNWRMLHQSQWKQLNKLNVYQTNSISWINFTLVSSQCAKISQYVVQIKNKEISKSIQKILNNKKKEFFQIHDKI